MSLVRPILGNRTSREGTIVDIKATRLNPLAANFGLCAKGARSCCQPERYPHITGGGELWDAFFVSLW